MNIHEAAARSGLSAATIRFYERRGVLPRPPRRANGYRTYTEAHVATLRLARGLRDLGLPLPEIGAVLRLAHDGTCGDLRAGLLATLERTLVGVAARLAELRRVQEHLADLHAGLRAMHPEREDVSGMAPCDCVRLVSGRV